MNFNEYQRKASETAVYPDAGTGSISALAYCGLGAAGEAGEVANKVKKIMRGDSPLTYERRVEIRQEIGGVIWYLSQLSRELGFNFDEAAEENVSILADRKLRDVLKGSGDNR